MTEFPEALTPRHLTSVVMEEGDGQVIVTFGLGAELTAGEYFGYAVDYYGTDGNGGKRFGVRLSPTEVKAYVFDWESATQANYAADTVHVTDEAIVATYRDASIGVDEVGTIKAFSHMGSDDADTDVAVTLLR
ncbi:hypothetical protein [Curtobacterium sp. PhB137]|uniref:hypothetical protein n=1 Tax=Curtobacterium sp. PhB137 TaxID=2485182 RepID=UPI000F4FCEA8|nr:hypothetical protein [Curtobacterium sp. PhB137]